MLSRRVAAKASPLRSATAAVAARRLPIVQQRTFLPQYNKNIDERYPAYPNPTEVEDPNMVRRDQERKCRQADRQKGRPREGPVAGPPLAEEDVRGKKGTRARQVRGEHIIDSQRC